MTDAELEHAIDEAWRDLVAAAEQDKRARMDELHRLIDRKKGNAVISVTHSRAVH